MSLAEDAAADGHGSTSLTAGAAFSQTLTAAGGLAPYTYTLQSGTLPVGLTCTAARKMLRASCSIEQP